MKALGCRLRPPKPRFTRRLHSQANEGAALALAQPTIQASTPSGRSTSSAVTIHLARKQAAAALDEFRNSLQTSESPDTLEQCIIRFSRYRQYDHMKKALSAFLDHGYSPSPELWAHVLYVAGLAVSAPTDIRPYFQKGLQAAINDEDSLLSLIRYTARYGLIEIGEELFKRYSERLKQESTDGNAQPPPAFWAALIDGRARVSDMDGAFSWFMRWRTSPAHPGSVSEDAASLIEGSRNYTGRLAAVAPAHVALRNVFAPMNDRVIEDLESTSTNVSRDDSDVQLLPDPAPYIVLLRHFAAPGSMPSLRLLELMASDGVPLTTATMNGLIDSEFKRKEKGQLASVLSLYEKMRTNPDPAYQPDFHTFFTLFKTYREPRQTSSIANPAPKPTKLARMAELPPPSEELLYNPRALFVDLCNKHTSLKLGFQDPDFITAPMLEVAVGAFVRTRDFTGCAAALSAYKILRIEPSSRLHAVITFGLLRARMRGEAFHRRDQEYAMSDEEATRLRRHIDHLNDLGGYERPIIARAVKLENPDYEANQTSIFAVQNNFAEVQLSKDDFATRIWNDRLVPRTDSELRDTRRYEFRYVSPLVDLLRRASGLELPRWNAEVQSVQADFESALRRYTETNK